jgi:hypothetical protein
MRAASYKAGGGAISTPKGKTLELWDDNHNNDEYDTVATSSNTSTSTTTTATTNSTCTMAPYPQGLASDCFSTLVNLKTAPPACPSQKVCNDVFAYNSMDRISMLQQYEQHLRQQIMEQQLMIQQHSDWLCPLPLCYNSESNCLNKEDALDDWMEMLW